MSDVDGPAVSTTLSVTHGALDLTGFTQTVGQPVGTGTITSGAGTGATVTGHGTDSLVVSGTVAQINGALDGMGYTPVADFNTLLQVVAPRRR